MEQYITLTFFSKCTFNYKGKEINFSDVSNKWETWYERLTKAPPHGFSFQRRCSLISYIDQAMTEEYGGYENNILWTRQNLRDTIKEQIINNIKSKLKPSD